MVYVIKIFALKIFKINIHQNVSRAFNILHYFHFFFPLSGLPLVVAQLSHVRFHGFLPLHLLRALLHHQTQHLWLRVHSAVLRLHRHHGLPLLLAHW